MLENKNTHVLALWKPREDITLHELALCIPYIFKYAIKKEELSFSHFRHFEVIN